MESFSEGEVIIYEAHLDDRLMVIEKIYPKDHTYRYGGIILRSIDGLDSRDTTVDRIRKATREVLTNRILRLEASLATLRYAMRNQTFGENGAKPGLLKQAGVKCSGTVKIFVRPEDQVGAKP